MAEFRISHIQGVPLAYTSQLNRILAAISQQLNRTNSSVSNLSTTIQSAVVVEGTSGTPASPPGGGTASSPLIVKNIAFADSPYTVTSVQNQLILADATGGNITANLPAASGSANIVSVKRSDNSSNEVDITPNGTDTIDGTNAPYALSGVNYPSVTLVDGASGAWFLT